MKNFNWAPYIIEDNFLSIDHYHKLVKYNKELTFDHLPVHASKRHLIGTEIVYDFLKLEKGEKRNLVYKRDMVPSFLDTQNILPIPLIKQIHYSIYPNLCDQYVKLSKNPKKIKRVVYVNVKLRSGKTFSIHNDLNQPKIFSAVVYIAPEKNYGTFLHETDNPNSNKLEIEWKPNRVFSFVPDKNTWHSYTAHSDFDHRNAFIINFY